MERSRLVAAIVVVLAIPLAVVTSGGEPERSREIWIPKKKKPAPAPAAAAPTSPTAPAANPAGPDVKPTAAEGPPAVVPKPAPKTTPPEKPKPTPNVGVALTESAPVEAGKTILWTAAFQSAWDELVERSGGADGIELGTPAKPEDVKALNAGKFDDAAVEAGVVVKVVGAADEKHWKSIDKATKRPRPAEAPPPNEKDMLAYAHFDKSVRYDVGLARTAEPLLFGATKTPVHAYGLLADAKADDPVERRRRAQVLVHLPPSAPEADAGKVAVVELKAAAGTRVVVSGRAPKATLAETWKDVAAVLATPGVVAGAGSRVAIPRVGVDVSHDFMELVPATVKGEDATLVFAHEDAILSVDERSVVGAEPPTKADDPGGTKVDVEIAGPFLVALLADKAERPYALLWVGSDEGLSR